MKKQLIRFFIPIIFSIFMMGCMKDPELEKFNEDMTAFKDRITEISYEIDSIDPSGEMAVEELLSCLDQMNEQFSILASMEIPKQFSSIESITAEAAENMQFAVEYYHQAYEAEEYDENLISIASQYYGRAMKRLSIISDVLQGKIPDDEDIQVIQDTSPDFEPIVEE